MISLPFKCVWVRKTSAICNSVTTVKRKNGIWWSRMIHDAPKDKHQTERVNSSVMGQTNDLMMLLKTRLQGIHCTLDWTDTWKIPDCGETWTYSCLWNELRNGEWKSPEEGMMEKKQGGSLEEEGEKWWSSLKSKMEKSAAQTTNVCRSVRVQLPQCVTLCVCCISCSDRAAVRPLEGAGWAAGATEWWPDLKNWSTGLKQTHNRGQYLSAFFCVCVRVWENNTDQWGHSWRCWRAGAGGGVDSCHRSRCRRGRRGRRCKPSRWPEHWRSAADLSGHRGRSGPEHTRWGPELSMTPAAHSHTHTFLSLSCVPSNVLVLSGQ